MIIIYYKDKETGQITYANRAKDGQTMTDLAPLIAEYNSKGKLAAAAVKVANDSLEAFLFNKMNERKKYDQEVLRDAIEAIQDALDYMRTLED